VWRRLTATALNLGDFNTWRLVKKINSPLNYWLRGFGFLVLLAG
jgi:hypothetical protein